MAGLFDNARPLDRYRSLLAPGRPSRLYTIESPYTLSRPGPAWQHAGILPGKWRDIVTERDPIYGAPQATERQTAWGIPGMATEMAGSLLNVLEAPSTGVMPTPADILNVTPMTSAPGLLAKIPAGAMASGMARRAAAPEPAARSPLGLFSPTEQAALDLKQTKLTPDQARASLANLGAKKEEMQWMGLDEFLDGRLKLGQGVTQDELIDFARRNRVEVEEVTYGGPDPDALVRQADELMAEGQRVQASGDLDGARVLFGRHDDLQRQAEGIFDAPNDQGLLPAPRYSEYTLPGGENYREVVLTMPQRTPPVHAERYTIEEAEDGLFKVLNSNREVVEMEFTREAAEDAARQFSEGSLVATPGGSDLNFVGGHFPDKNILAHVRMNDRIDADGKKVLFIEEIQSDWHQRGRQQGYQTQDDAKVKSLLAEKDEIVNRGTRDASTGGLTIQPQDLRRYNELVNQIEPLLPIPAGSVPDAPFKQSWSDLAMKRVMQMAADGGYDRVAWTTGRQQADRYDLSRQISEVHYSGSNFKAYDHDGATVISRTGVKESDLPDLIGKEAADKLMAQKSDGTLRSLVGQDLKVGGEGMFSFYDKMLPKKAQKIARRLDKDAKVGKASLQHGDVWSIDITPAMRGAAQQRGQPLFANPGAAAIPGLLSTQQPAPPPNMIMDNRQRIPRGLLDNAA